MKPPPAPEKIKALLPKLADLPKEAEDKARTEAEYRNEIRTLKSQLATAERSQPKVSAPDPGEVKKAIAAAVRDLATFKKFTGQQAQRVTAGLVSIEKDLATLRTFTVKLSEAAGKEGGSVESAAASGAP